MVHHGSEDVGGNDAVTQQCLLPLCPRRCHLFASSHWHADVGCWLEAIDTTRDYVMQHGSKEGHTVGIVCGFSSALEAERWRSAAACSRSGAEAAGSRLQCFVRRWIAEGKRFGLPPAPATSLADSATPPRPGAVSKSRLRLRHRHATPIPMAPVPSLGPP